MSAPEPAIVRLVNMAQAERPHTQRILDAVAELGDVREWAEALSTLADAIEQLETATEDWRDAERSERADARDEVLSALQAVDDAYADVEALPPMGLGPEATP